MAEEKKARDRANATTWEAVNNASLMVAISTDHSSLFIMNFAKRKSTGNDDNPAPFKKKSIGPGLSHKNSVPQTPEPPASTGSSQYWVVQWYASISSQLKRVK